MNKYIHKYNVGDLLFDHWFGTFLLIVRKEKNGYMIFCSRDRMEKHWLKENLETDREIEKVA
jgi:hypothetical protein